MTATLAHFGTGFDHAEYVAAVPSIMKKEDLTYLNRFDPRNGVVIANMNDKSIHIGPEDERLLQSEDIWQSWCRVTHQQSTPVSKMRVIVRLVVVNEASKKVIKETLLRSSCTREETTQHRVYRRRPGLLCVAGKHEWRQLDENAHRPQRGSRLSDGRTSRGLEQGNGGRG